VEVVPAGPGRLRARPALGRRAGPGGRLAPAHAGRAQPVQRAARPAHAARAGGGAVRHGRPVPRLQEGDRRRDEDRGRSSDAHEEPEEVGGREVKQTACSSLNT